MAFVVMFSAMSFTTSKHFCGDELVNFSIFTLAESCGMESNDINTTNECQIGEEDCCTDVIDVIEGQDFVKSEIQLDYNQELFVTSFLYTYINLFEGLEENVVPFKNYSSPVIVEDIQVLDNVYLI
jgi:hypothetical protein